MNREHVHVSCPGYGVERNNARTCRLALGVLALALFAGPALGSRVVAIGDIHGDLAAFEEILRVSGLTDAENRWVGGDSTLVQTGDFSDRGADAVTVMELLMKLQREAPESGGQVVVLMGNHEAMNLLGLTRDVNPKVYEGFIEEGSEARRDASWDGFKKWRKQRSRKRPRGVAPVPDADGKTWREQVPIGYLEYLDSVGPEGRFGKWLRSLPIVAQIDDVVFLHAGIPPSLASRSNEELNETVRDEIRRFDACRERLIADGVTWETSDPIDMAREGLAEIEALRKRISRAPESARPPMQSTLDVLSSCIDYRDWYLVREDGPLWFRGLARWDPEDGLDWLNQSLRKRGAAHFVAGHTPRRSGRVETRFGGRAILIDTGMLREVYGGRAAALIIEDGRFNVLYPQGREELELEVSGVPTAPANAWKGPGGTTLPFTSDEEVLDFLRTAEMDQAEEIAKGINKPLRLTLRKDGVEAFAVWRNIDVEGERLRLKSGRNVSQYRDSYRFEVAAYEVDRLIGLGRVPPAVLRSYRGQPGSLQIWIHGVFDEEERRAKDLKPPVPLDWVQQNQMRDFFDSLIQNFDRNQGNLLIDETSWKVWLIDHTRSFLEDPEPAALEKILRCDRQIWNNFVQVSETQIKERLDGVLRAYELSSLISRWETIAAHLTQLIEQRSEAAVLFGPAPNSPYQ